MNKLTFSKHFFKIGPFEVPDDAFKYFSSCAINLPCESFQCQVFYREANPATEADKIILAYLSDQEKISFRDLADALGLSIYDAYDQLGGFKYSDAGEEALFSHFLKSLQDFELIQVDTDHAEVSITQFGLQAVNTGVKYAYFHATFAGHQIVQAAYDQILDFQPLGLEPSLTNIVRRKSDEPLLQSARDGFIQQAVQSQIDTLSLIKDKEVLEISRPNCFKPLSIYIYTHFFKDALDARWVVAAHFNNIFLHQLSTILVEEKNEELLNEIVLECEYQVLIKEPFSRIDALTLHKFRNKWNYTNTLADKRLLWDDPGVLNFFFTHLAAHYWSILCTYIPLSLLESKLDSFSEKGDFYVISSRVSEKLIFDDLSDKKEGNTKYRWDFASLSRRDGRFVAKLLQLCTDKRFDELRQNQDWDWQTVCASVPDKDLVLLLPYYPFDRFALSEKSSEFLKQVLSKELTEQDRFWNWPLVQEKVGLAFIWRHIDRLNSFISWDVFLKHYFTIDGATSEPIALNRLKEYITIYASRIRPVAYVTYQLSKDWIRFLNKVELLRWQSTPSSDGFELSPSLEWTSETFGEFHKCILTRIGKAYISSRIQDIRLIDTFPDFVWNWEELSRNVSLNWTKEYTKKHSDKIIWSVFLKRFETDKIVERIHNLLELSRNEGCQQEMWRYFNSNIPAPQLLALYDTYHSFINFSLLCTRDPEAVIAFVLDKAKTSQALDFTTLVLKSSIESLERFLLYIDQVNEDGLNAKIQDAFREATKRFTVEFLIENARRYVHDWDWTFITANIPTHLLNKNLSAFAHKWDWKYLTRSTFTKEQLIGGLIFLNDVKSKLDWAYILEGSYLTNQELIDSLEQISYAIEGIDSQEVKADLWKTITHRVPIGFIFPTLSTNLPRFDYHEHFSKFRFDWEVLSGDKRLSPFLTLRFVDYFLSAWHWPTLSKNEEINFKSNYLSKFKTWWDWEFISLKSTFIRGDFKKNEWIYGAFHQQIRWDIFSARTDVHFEKDLLVKYKDKNWNWGLISRSPKLHLDIELLKTLPDKPWDFKSFSGNQKLRLSTELLINFQDKDWDYDLLSSRQDVVPSDFLFESLVNKPWNWEIISTRSDVEWTHSMLKKVAQKAINWTAISRNTKIGWSTEILDAFTTKLDWEEITINYSVPILEVGIERFIDYWSFLSLSRREEIAKHPELLVRYKQKAWDWKYISASTKFTFGNAELHALKTKLDWDELSKREWSMFQIEWLDEFSEKWDWIKLAENYSIKRTSELYVRVEAWFDRNPKWEFLRRMEMQLSSWRGYIYHYAHLRNAASILNEGAIKCRQHALHDDQASQVIVNRKTEPHDYARFYFRPQTPYQYYTENLGRAFPLDVYESYRYKNVEYPKCPVPIFIRVKLKEVLMDSAVDCFVTDNNFHADDKNVHLMKVEDSLNRFDFAGVYKTFNSILGPDFRDEIVRYKRQVQQEFVVKRALSLDYYDVEVICQSELDKKALLSILFQPEKWQDKIKVDTDRHDHYLNKNDKVKVEIFGKRVKVTTSFEGPGELILKAASLENIDGNLKSNTNSSEISGYEHISADLADDAQHFEVHFLDESRIKWLIFSRS